MTSNYNIAFTNLVALKQKNKTIFLIKMTEQQFNKTNPRRKSGGDSLSKNVCEAKNNGAAGALEGASPPQMG